MFHRYHNTNTDLDTDTNTDTDTDTKLNIHTNNDTMQIIHSDTNNHTALTSIPIVILVSVWYPYTRTGIFTNNIPGIGIGPVLILELIPNKDSYGY